MNFQDKSSNQIFIAVTDQQKQNYMHISTPKQYISVTTSILYTLIQRTIKELQTLIPCSMFNHSLSIQFECFIFKFNGLLLSILLLSHSTTNIQFNIHTKYSTIQTSLNLNYLNQQAYNKISHIQTSQ